MPITRGKAALIGTATVGLRAASAGASWLLAGGSLDGGPSATGALAEFKLVSFVCRVLFFWHGPELQRFPNDAQCEKAWALIVQRLWGCGP